MSFHGQAAAHKPKSTIWNAKNQLEWGKACRHWTLDQKLVLWSEESPFYHLAVRQKNLCLEDARRTLPA